MEHINGVENIKLKEESVVILGNFDGIHLGHQKLFEEAKQIAHEKGLKTVLFSFFPHPTWVLGNNPKSLLMSREEKKDRIKELGIDIYIEYPFSAEFAQMSGEDFVTKILLEKLNCKIVSIGKNYFFGQNQEGDVAYMRALARKYNFEVLVVEELRKNDKTVSSTLIRQLVEDGEIDLANQLIGQAYKLRGTIIKGKQLGRTLGFPTVNLIPDPIKVLPPNGVYITKAHLLGKVYYGLTNIGFNPTVDGNEKKAETFIFDFCSDVYGEEITIEIIKHIRPEIKFNSLVELTTQMNKDKCSALEYIEDL